MKTLRKAIVRYGDWRETCEVNGQITFKWGITWLIKRIVYYPELKITRLYLERTVK